MTNKFFFFILKQTHTIGNKTTFRAIFNYFLTFAVGPVGVGLDPRPLQPVVAPLYPSCRRPGCKTIMCMTTYNIVFIFLVLVFTVVLGLPLFQTPPSSASSHRFFLPALKYGDMIKINRNSDKRK